MRICVARVSPSRENERLRAHKIRNFLCNSDAALVCLVGGVDSRLVGLVSRVLPLNLSCVGHASDKTRHRLVLAMCVLGWVSVCATAVYAALVRVASLYDFVAPLYLVCNSFPKSYTPPPPQAPPLQLLGA